MNQIEDAKELPKVPNPFLVLPWNDYCCQNVVLSCQSLLSRSASYFIPLFVIKLYYFVGPIVIDIFINEIWLVAGQVAIVGGVVVFGAMFGQIFGGLLGQFEHEGCYGWLLC